jgi:hypothetical protein
MMSWIVPRRISSMNLRAQASDLEETMNTTRWNIVALPDTDQSVRVFLAACAITPAIPCAGAL